MINSIRQYTRQRFGIKPLTDTGTQLETWLQGALGQALLEDEQARLDQILANIYGFHLMQLGISRDVDLTRASTINHRFALTPVLSRELSPLAPSNGNGHDPDDKSLRVSGQADMEKIPLGSETIDVALLHHVLEFTPNPHQLLRETARTVIPRGYIVVVGFNPVSWVGVFKKFGRLFNNRIQWRHHSLRLGRVMDWLRLLDFEPVSVQQGFYRWPIDHPRFLAKTGWFEKMANKLRMPMGGFYLIVARKDVVAMTPIRPNWRGTNPIESLVGTRPSTRVPEASSKQMH